METDFYFRNDNSIILLFPKSVSAQIWINDHVALDTWQDSDNIAIEPRIFDDIVAGTNEEGLTISQTE
jgi:hypothetical protein